jgi:hypothetical protein
LKASIGDFLAEQRKTQPTTAAEAPAAAKTPKTPEEERRNETEVAAHELEASKTATRTELDKNREKIAGHPKGKEVISETERALSEADKLFEEWREVLSTKAEPKPVTPPVGPSPTGAEAELERSLAKQAELRAAGKELEAAAWDKGIGTLRAYLDGKKKESETAERAAKAKSEAEARAKAAAEAKAQGDEEKGKADETAKAAVSSPTPAPQGRQLVPESAEASLERSLAKQAELRAQGKEEEAAAWDVGIRKLRAYIGEPKKPTAAPDVVTARVPSAEDATRQKAEDEERQRKAADALAKASVPPPPPSGPAPEAAPAKPPRFVVTPSGRISGPALTEEELEKGRKKAAEERAAEPTVVIEDTSTNPNIELSPEEHARLATPERPAGAPATPEQPAATPEQVRSGNEARLQRPERMTAGAYLRESWEHFWERPNAKNWFDVLFLRLGAWKARQLTLWRAGYQEHYQNKLDFAQKKVADYEEILKDVGIMGKLWYGNRLRVWQAEAAKMETKVMGWNARREQWASRHATLQHEVVSRYEREVGPYRILAEDLKVRLDAQVRARDALAELRKEAVERLAAAEGSANRRGWFKMMGPRARKCVDGIKREISEMDRRIAAAAQSAHEYNKQLAGTIRYVTDYETKIATVARQLAMPELSGIKTPQRSAPVPMPGIGRVESPAVHTARAAEAPAPLPETDPSQREWKLDRFVEQWNLLRPNQMIESAKVFIDSMRQNKEYAKFVQAGRAKASELFPILEEFLSITTLPFNRKQFNQDRQFFLKQAKPS